MSGPDFSADGRERHLAWCKEESLSLLRAGKPGQAVSSMVENMTMRPDCKVNDMLLKLGVFYVAGGFTDELKGWIEGFR